LNYPLQPANYYSAPTYQSYPAPIYSAPPNPELGYYAQPTRNYQQQPRVVNIYNYYSAEFAPEPTDDRPATVAPGNYTDAPRSPAAPAAQPLDSPVGTRFYSSTLLSGGGQLMLFTVQQGGLYAGPEIGPGQLVASSIDESAGVLAAYQPGIGFSLVYRVGDAIVASWTDGARWYEEPLPEFVDFSQELTIGMVGGSPWVVFNGFDSRRHIYSYTGGWQSLGSATRPEN
jgi:hypothetical protein